MANADHFLMKGIKETIQTRGLTAKAKDTSIAFSKLGNYASAIGACVLILEDFFVREN